ncbi:MAG: phenylalanine--tRNA ligase subunit beta [Hydrocarboniphaga sp.]|uniref:phenylalanine--tRNA ligase subunit beta n=1 Tax=Hydrocarboniphaga sp. TaxID=2033016 RepID=UPI0026395104|nr:phenylalanine--tRNA ligase subunit beta [Hydrocarboniphaga sp.]MDB5969109.1 phenylalanine--tRNA ligase subunit beta [Hydrocarboniphaga sp.]
MKVSENWLREWVNPQATTQQIAEKLVMAGLELEIEPAVAEPSHKVVVGRIVSIAPHPNAERLRVCTVDAGAAGAPTIVCGAANARVGLLAPVALPGARLPGGVEIEVGELRGVESRGMLCSAKELGLAEKSEGLMELDADARVGQPIEQHLALADNILNLELTPNRGDCLSVQGLAREISALYGLPLSRPRIKPAVVVGERRFSVEIENLADCSNFAGRVVVGLNPKARTPTFMRERLRRSGIRCIHPLVDITNYVMIELGQPMHAYDADKLSGSLRVRRARTGEKLTLLNDVEVTLDQAELLVTDERGPLGLAGAMGGAASAVSATTTRVFFEAACFSMQAVAGVGRRHKITSDALYRFERGVDPDLQRAALERASELAIQICGGEAGPITHVGRTQPEPVSVRLRRARLVQLTGQDIQPREIESLLSRLGITLVHGDVGTWTAKIPSYRYDLRIEADLIEEVVRLYGYERIPARPYAAQLAPSRPSETRRGSAQVMDALVARGWQEVVNLAFEEQRMHEALSPQLTAIALDNPIAETHSLMRTSLWGGLIAAWLHNRARQVTRVRLFESGVCFHEADGRVVENPRLSGIAAGTVASRQWGQPARAVDFFDVKADVASLLEACGGDVRFEAAEHPALHPGQSARVLVDGQPAGWLGRLHPRVAKALDLAEQPLLFELEWAVLRQARMPVLAVLSEFPSSRRDLSLQMPREVSAQVLCDVARDSTGAHLQRVNVFDVYRAAEADQTGKSVSVELHFQDASRTLTLEEVDASIEEIKRSLQERLGAVVRA